MQQSFGHLLTIINEHSGNGLSFLTIAGIVFLYVGLMTVILKTFQYLKERDFKRYK